MSGVHCQRFPDCLAFGEGNTMPTCGRQDCPGMFGRKLAAVMFTKTYDASERPSGSNADEWHLFLCRYADNRASFPNGLSFLAVQIAEAIDNAAARRNEV